jgi:hypothetical protein
MKPSSIRELRNRLKPLAVIWCVHGVLLIMGALAISVLAEQTQSDLWLDVMERLGFWHMVKPIQTGVLVFGAMRLGFVLTGLFSLAVGIFAIAKPAWSRWPLHFCAFGHMILVPWATWIGHKGMGEWATHPMTISTELSTLVFAEIGCILAFFVVERARKSVSNSPTTI